MRFYPGDIVYHETDHLKLIVMVQQTESDGSFLGPFITFRKRSRYINSSPLGFFNPNEQHFERIEENNELDDFPNTKDNGTDRTA